MSRQQLLTLIGVLLALFLGALDQTIVATALPEIVSDLQGLDRFSWVGTAYLITATAFVPIYGKLADMYDHKKIELCAIGIFLSGSFLCGIAGEFGSLPILGDGMNQLIFYRAIQGIGGGGLFAMAFILIAGLFPPAQRAKYQGMVGAVFGISSVLGPWLGGILTDQGGGLIEGIEGWRWVFYVNLPFGIIALWFIFFKMPYNQRASATKPLDYPSALLLLVGLIALVSAIQLQAVDETLTYIRYGLFILSAVCLSIFYRLSKKSDNPILNLNLFRNKSFSTINLAAFFIGISFMSIVMFTPLFMIQVKGLNATDAGLSMIPLSFGMLLASIVSGYLVSRINHYKLILIIALGIAFLALFFLSRINRDTSVFHICMLLAIGGIGIGPTMPLFPLIVQNAVDPGEIGQATSSVQFFRQIGGAFGISIMGAVLAYFIAKGGNPSLSAGLHESGALTTIDVATQELIASALQYIYLYASLLTLAGWLALCFVPQLSLRKED